LKNCFLAEFPLEAAIKEKDVEVEWIPFKLRPLPQPKFNPEEDYLQTVWEQSVYLLARKMGVEIKLPDISSQPYTHLAFEGYQYAREYGHSKESLERAINQALERNLSQK
jgi:predicted DsbA family dithiol-disulfide isomerase